MKSFIRLAITFMAMIALFAGLITAAYAIPSRLLSHNAERSVEFMKASDFKGATRWHKFDMYTDSLMINMARNADYVHPFVSAMECPYIYYDEQNPLADTLSVDGEIWTRTSRQGFYRVSYGRYWQGHQVILRPALTFTDIRVIRWVNFTLAVALMIWVIILMWRRLPRCYAICFGLTCLLAGLPVLMLSMQFVAVWVILLITTAVMLQWPATVRTTANAAIIFMITGGITAFMDFFTTPILTLGLPLAVAIPLIKTRSNPWTTVIAMSAIWIAGYAGVWVSKWIIGGIATQTDLISNALESVVHRSVNDTGDTSYPAHVWTIIKGDIRLRLAIVAAGVTIGWAYYRSSKGLAEMIRYSYLLLIAAMPVVWYIVVNNHSTSHFWFTWRIFTLTFFALSLFWAVSTDATRLFKPRKIIKRCQK